MKQPPTTGPDDRHPAHDPSVGDEVNAVVVGVMPWVISLTLHAAVVILAVFIVWSTVTQEDPEQVIVPTTEFSAAPPTPVKTTNARKLESSRASSGALSRRPLPGRTAPLITEVGTDDGPLVFNGESPGTRGPRVGPTRAPTDTSVSILGIHGNATRLAYLIDASGSMIETMPFVILELKRSIGKLSAKQSFTIIFFREDGALEVPVPNVGLKRATAANKAKAIRWIDAASGNVVPRGKSNPIKALQLALNYEPQLLVVLSDDITGDGRYEVDQRNLLADIREHNTGNTKISTIQFLYEDKLASAIGLDGKPLGPEARTLYKVSDMTGGQHKFMDAYELGIK